MQTYTENSVRRHIRITVVPRVSKALAPDLSMTTSMLNWSRKTSFSSRRGFSCHRKFPPKALWSIEASLFKKQLALLEQQDSDGT